MKKYLIISVLVLTFSVGTAIAATNDFVADGPITIESVSGTGVTADLTISDGSKANSVTSNAGVLTVTNPGSAFKVTGSSVNIISISAESGSETSCVNNVNPGTTYLQLPESAGTYTVSPSKNGCSSGSGGGGSGGGGGGGGGATPPVIVTGGTTDAGCTVGALYSSTTGQPCSTTTTVTSVVPMLPLQASPIATIALTRGLKLGIVGADVQNLQRFLNANGFVLTLSGTGSPGNETTYFGQVTQAAVLKFQLANSIVQSENDPGAGTVGPKTRAKINSMGSAGVLVPVVAPAASQTINPQLLQSLIELLRQFQLQAPR